MTENRNITLIPSDNTVVIDGVAHNVDLSSMHAFIQAVQWDGPSQTGHIEFVQTQNTPYRLNIAIHDISYWVAAIEAWGAAEFAGRGTGSG